MNDDCCEDPLHADPVDPFICIRCGHDTLPELQRGKTS